MEHSLPVDFLEACMSPMTLLEVMMEFSDACVFGEYVICWNTGCPASPSSSMASFCLKTKASNWRMLKERNIANHWTSFQDLNMDKRYYKSGIIHQMSSCSSRKHRTQTCRERASGRTYKAQCHAGKRIRISTLSAKYDIWLLQLNVLSHNSRGPANKHHENPRTMK